VTQQDGQPRRAFFDGLDTEDDPIQNWAEPSADSPEAAEQSPDGWADLPEQPPSPTTDGTKDEQREAKAYVVPGSSQEPADGGQSPPQPGPGKGPHEERQAPDQAGKAGGGPVVQLK
jgi:hypothetical protein